jgi:hypothetical protein
LIFRIACAHSSPSGGAAAGSAGDSSRMMSTMIGRKTTPSTNDGGFLKEWT